MISDLDDFNVQVGRELEGVRDEVEGRDVPGAAWPRHHDKEAAQGLPG